ncbi:unnamed protein product [Ixodes persulcatus]
MLSYSLFKSFEYSGLLRSRCLQPCWCKRGFDRIRCSHRRRVGCTRRQWKRFVLIAATPHTLNDFCTQRWPETTCWRPCVTPLAVAHMLSKGNIGLVCLCLKRWLPKSRTNRDSRQRKAPTRAACTRYLWQACSLYVHVK